MTAADLPSSAGARWPDLFLVGAAHAGTSLLRGHLCRHPALFMAEPEEPHFFSDVRPARRFERAMPVVHDEATYLALFAAARPDQLLGEASTSYLWSPDAPGRIAAATPGACIVILLRDPIARAWAHHRHDAAEGLERRGFLRAIRDELSRPARWGVEPVYLGAGFYADALDRYLAAFGPGRVLVRFAESVVADPRPAARELLTWLGLDPEGLPDGPPPAPTPPAPASKTVRGLLAGLRRRDQTVVAPPDARSVMDDTIRRLLEEVYASDVARVSERLGVIPPWSITPGL